MMRRIVLLFFALSVLGRSQTVQQLAQPPIVVKVEMPSESAWTTLVKLVIPTILGAGLALYGVRQTNKHNTAENAANREHQLRLETAKAEIAVKYKSRDNRWAFRKDVYCRLIQTTSALINNLADLRHILKNANGENVTSKTAPLVERRMELTRELMNNARLAPLAAADNVVNALEAAKPRISGARVHSSVDWEREITDTIAGLEELLKHFQDSGRKDLRTRNDEPATLEGEV
jgi:hypothetical protein